jgi:hypothetical protein
LAQDGESGGVVDDGYLWHVTLTVGGAAQDLSDLHRALVRLLAERPFTHSLHYDAERAEICYWEESVDVVDAASLALRLWVEHRASADLPDWKVVGLEVVDRETFLSREARPPVLSAVVVPRRF